VDLLNILPSTMTVSSGFSTKLKVAVVQFLPSTDVEDATARNLDRMAHFIERAWSDGARLVVFPELATSGYRIGEDAVKRAVNAAPTVIAVSQSMLI
jgi:predicted amidohydrolase